MIQCTHNVVSGLDTLYITILFNLKILIVMNNVNPKQTKNDRCDVNFSKLKDRSVKVYMGTEKHQGVEIIGSKGKYAVLTDSKNERLSALRGRSGTLKEVKRAVAVHLCSAPKDPVPTETHSRSTTGNVDPVPPTLEV